MWLFCWAQCHVGCVCHQLPLSSTDTVCVKWQHSSSACYRQSDSMIWPVNASLTQPQLLQGNRIGTSSSWYWSCVILCDSVIDPVWSLCDSVWFCDWSCVILCDSVWLCDPPWSCVILCNQSCAILCDPVESISMYAWNQYWSVGEVLKPS